MLGPLGREDGVCEMRGHVEGRAVIYCTACGELFLARHRLIGAMRTAPIPDELQAKLSHMWRKQLHHRAPMARAERDLQRSGDVLCDTCGKTFRTERARDEHAAAKHIAPH